MIASSHTLPISLLWFHVSEKHDPEDRRMMPASCGIVCRENMSVDGTFLYTIGKGTFQLTTKDSQMIHRTILTYIKASRLRRSEASLDSLLAAAVPTKTAT